MILVSSCLCGINCKYNGGNNYNEKVMNYLKDKEYIMVCPEVLGGLLIPRSPSEIKVDKVINKDGIDVTEEYRLGALKTLDIAKKNNVSLCIMKSNSPSCGTNKIYDGTFSKKLIQGDGVTVSLLKENGIKVITENDL